MTGPLKAWSACAQELHKWAMLLLPVHLMAAHVHQHAPREISVLHALLSHTFAIRDPCCFPWWTTPGFRKLLKRNLCVQAGTWHAFSSEEAAMRVCLSGL